jgi:hypothetical protein
MDDNFKISDEVKIKIVHDLIEPFYLEDIKSLIRNKKCWKLSGQIFETVSKILVAVGGIVSFSSGYFNDPILSFFAGSISTLSLATLQFSSFAYMENKKQSQDLNVLLKKLNIDIIPILEKRYDSINTVALGGNSVDHQQQLQQITIHPPPPPPQPALLLTPPSLQRKPIVIPSSEDGLIVSEFIPPNNLTT